MEYAFFMATFSFTNEPVNSANGRQGTLEKWFSLLDENTWRKVGTFIYEMPVAIVAMAIAGVASTIFFPMFTIPCFGIVTGTVLSRLGVRIIDNHRSDLLLEIKNDAIELNKKHPNIMKIAFIFATIAGLFCPATAWIASIGAGALKGVIIEVEIHKKNSNFNRNNSK